MKGHEKASSARSTSRRVRRRTFFSVASICVLFASLSAPALAYDPNGDGIPGPATLPAFNYEQVSPVEKDSADMAAINPFLAGDGKRALLTAMSPFGEIPSATVVNNYVAARGPEGWEAMGITPAPIGSATGLYATFLRGVTDDLRHTAWCSNMSLAPGAPNVEQNIYLGDNQTGAVSWLTESPFPGALELGVSTCAGSNASYSWGDASSDLRRGLVATTSNLTSDTTDGEIKTYLWSEGEELSLASIDSAGNPLPAPATPAGSYAGETLFSATGNAISDDGERYFFYAPNVTATSPGPGSGTLWVREENGVDPPTTTQVGTGDVRFWMATPDGSTVLYTTGLSIDGSLFAYDVETGVSTEISETTIPEGPLVSSVVAMTDDASTIYFTAGGKLTPDAPDPAKTGEGNFWDRRLFRWHNGQLEYIADLGSALVKGGGFVRSSLPTRDERISEDGSVLAFLADAQLTSYDNQGMTMLYVYEAETGELSCPSCSPDGNPPIDARPSNEAPEVYITTNEGLATPSTLEQFPRGMTADGSKVYFSSADPLVSGDTNGNKYDAYVYDTQSGELDLISTGRSTEHSYYADNTSDAGSVTLWTREQLVGWDVDSNVDLYAAVDGGGFPEPAGEIPCEGDECQARPPVTPSLDRPVSASFSGDGNASRRVRCGRASVRQGNRCVRKRTLAKRKCRAKRGAAKQRCVSRRMSKSASSQSEGTK